MRIFRYIPHRLCAAYAAAGWIISELGPPHGFSSMLGEWSFEGDPIYPSEDGL